MDSMRFKFVFIVVLVGFFLISFSPLFDVSYAVEENQSRICYSYTFDCPTITKNTLFSREQASISIKNLSLSDQYGKPRLPEKHIRLLLPYQSTIKNISILPQTSFTIFDSLLNNIEIGLGGKSFSDNDSFSKENVPLLFNKNEYYPKEMYDLIGLQYKHGYPILFINLIPVQYNKEKQKLRYTTEIQITIETKSYTNDDVQHKPEMKNLIKNQIENPKMIDTYPDLIHFQQNTNKNYDYIIITSEELSKPSNSTSYSFQDLLNYRESQGLNGMIKTNESIQREFNGRDQQEKIRNFIKYAYTNWNTKWVLLGGDVEIIPIRYLDDIDGKEADEDFVTSDLYYQCLDGSYNYDGDEVWGEEYDGVDGQRIDLLAEVYVGRAPVDDEVDVSSFVEKTLSYEESDWTEGSYIKNVLSAGQKVWDGPGGYGAGYLERCIDFNSDYNQETYGIPTDNFNIISLYERDTSWVDDDVKNIINDGVSIINHVGHGSAAAAMKLTTYELNELNNSGKYGLFYSQACHAGQLEIMDECFAERWVNIPNKGGFAAIMDTGYGYGSVSDYDGADNRYAREFFDALFSPIEKISRIGVANQDSKEDNIWHINEKNMFHCYYNTILLGDPYVSIKGAEEAAADFSWSPDYPKTGEIITFTDQSRGMITYHTWEFGDGKSSHEKNPSHVFSLEKKYDVTLTVMDDQGYRSTTTYEIDIRDQWNPIPIISPSDTNVVNTTIYFSAEQSWDPDGSIVRYLWNFDDGTTSELMEPVHTYEEYGTYEVSLLVEDNNGNVAKTYSTIVILQQSPPFTPAINGPSSTFSGKQNEFSLVATDPENDDIQYGIKWDNDQQIEWTEWYPSGQQCHVSHQWDHPGIYEVTVRARDVHFGISNWSEVLIINVEDEFIPTIEIEKPVNGVYVNNRKIMPLFTSLVFGDIDICINATDASGINNVLFYIDDMLNPVAEVLHEPYLFQWDEFSFGRHTVKIVVTDNAGRENSNEFLIWKFF